MTKYLVSVGSEGIESLIDLDKAELDSQAVVAEKLRSKDPAEVRDPMNKTLFALSMRIRLNSHRNIESYVIIWEEDEKSLVSMINLNPCGFKALMKAKNIDPVRF